jgi:Flp pilus assembly protein TadG
MATGCAAAALAAVAGATTAAESTAVPASAAMRFRRYRCMAVSLVVRAASKGATRWSTDVGAARGHGGGASFGVNVGAVGHGGDGVPRCGAT